MNKWVIFHPRRTAKVKSCVCVSASGRERVCVRREHAQRESGVRVLDRGNLPRISHAHAIHVQHNLISNRLRLCGYGNVLVNIYKCLQSH